MKVKTNYSPRSFITAGKEYEVIDKGSIGAEIIADNGINIFIIHEGEDDRKGHGDKCAHLDQKHAWEIVK